MDASLGQVWGNLISYLVLKPVEKEANSTWANQTTKYDKCGADFSEKEYKGAEVVNQIERRTVRAQPILSLSSCRTSIPPSRSIFSA